VTLSSLGLLPQLSCPAANRCAGRVLVRGTVTNRTAAPIAPRVSVRLTPPGGGPARTTTVTVPRLRPGQSAPVRGALELAGRLRTWSPDLPRLYHARVQTLDGRRLVQRNEVAVGLRRVDVRGGLLYLNGRAVQLRGASIEEDVPGRGPALSTNDAKRIVGELLALHANVTRAQYPLNDALLEQFDRAGILVWSQAPIYHRDEQLRSAAQRATALATLRGTLLQTRNHASVLTESVANELSPVPDSVPGTREYIRSAVALVRQLAPGIPVSIDLLSYPGYPAQRNYAAFDLLGINNYFGWYTGRRGHSTASIDDLGPYLREAHTRYPRQALVMSEFGAEANVAGPATVKQTYAFQSRYLEQTLSIVGSLPFMSGAIYWTLREFAVKPRWDGGAHRHDVPRTAIHHKGLISYSGRPKPAFYIAARLFSHTPLYRVPGGSPKPDGPSGGWLPHISDSAWLFTLLGLVALAGALIARPRRRQRRNLAARDSSP
jgi:beta-glucuronidase